MITQAKIKIFTHTIADSELMEKEINEFIDSVSVIKNGMMVQESGRICIFYIPKVKEELPDGITKDDAMATVSEEMGKIQHNRMVAHMKLTFFKAKDLHPRGGKEQREQLAIEMQKTVREIEDFDMQIRQYREMIKEINDGEYKF